MWHVNTFGNYKLGEKKVENPSCVMLLFTPVGGIGCEGVDRGQSRHCLDVVEIYNPDGDFWRAGSPLPGPLLSLHTSASNAGVVGGKIYVCGFYRGAGNLHPYFPHPTPFCLLQQSVPTSEIK